MAPAQAFCKKMNEEQKDVHITMTHVMTLACCWGLYKMRRDVGHLPFGTFKSDKRMGVTVLCDVEGGKDLVPVTVWDGHKMTIFELAKFITAKVARAKKGQDKQHNESTALAKFIPSHIAQPLSFALTYIAANVGISIPAVKLRNDTFGQLVLTNVGSMGFQSAIAPLCPLVHALGYVCCGVIEKRAIVDPETDKISVAPMMTVAATGDHRYGDAAIFVPFFKSIRLYIGDPAGFDESKVKANVHYSEKKEA